MEPESTSRQTDEQLFTQLKDEGSTRAYTMLYNRYWGPLWNFARNAIREEDDAKDLVQEVFAALWEKREQIHIHTSFKSFLYKAVLNKTISMARLAKKAGAFFSIAGEELEAASRAGTNTTEEKLYEAELIAYFEQTLRRMPDRMREAFEASRFEELTYAEIGEKMNISSESVKSHIKSALKTLRKGLTTIVVLFS